MGRSLALRAGALVAVALLALAAPGSALAAAAPGGVTDTTGQTTVSPTDTSAVDSQTRPDPDTDRLGWEAGYWYDEELSIDTSDGLSRAEARKVLARSAARVERIRQLEFDRLPELTFVSRQEYSDVVGQSYESFNASTEQRLHQNTKFEALFFVGEEESYFQQQAANRGGSVAAFYTYQGIPQLDVSPGTIAIITPSDGTPSGIPETTLGHELTHALQDQTFGREVLRTSGTTEEAYNANLSLIEGDATYVGQTYALRCGEEWSCLSASGSGGGGALANLGLAVFSFTPYSETGAFVDTIRSERGWEGVNALYEPENRPRSTEQYIHPEKYGTDPPSEVTVEHRTAGDWEVLDLPNSETDYATFGEAGIYAMLLNPTLQSGSEVIVPQPSASGNPLVRFDFTHPASTGWAGDTLYPYVNGSSAATNETGYVWKTEWDSEQDAREFADAYRQLLDYHDAEPVGERTYVVPEPEFGRDFGDAFHVVRDGTTVTIVNAPTVDDLTNVRTSIDVQAGETTTTTDGPGTETTTAPGDTTTTTTLDGPGQPGFGPVTVALAALVVALVALVRRR